MKGNPKEHSRADMPVGMLLHHAALMHMNSMRRSMENIGVQKTYGPILKDLSENEGMTQTEIADNMRITAPSMSVNLQKMENAGLLIRQNDDADMRQVRLYLTEKGREIAEKANKEIALAEKRLTENLTYDEKKELKRILVKMLDSMNERGERI